MSSRTSPLVGGPGPNKTVAFSKATNSAERPNPTLARRGSEFGNNAVPSLTSQHQSMPRTGSRLRAEGFMVPPGSDAATLRRQVAALQIDLEAHIDGEQRLQSINQQLRERSFPLLSFSPRAICKFFRKPDFVCSLRSYQIAIIIGEGYIWIKFIPNFLGNLILSLANKKLSL